MPFLKRFDSRLRGNIKVIGDMISANNQSEDFNLGYKYLELPEKSKIIYSELIWGGICPCPHKNEFLKLNESVSLHIDRKSYYIKPDTDTYYNFYSNSDNSLYYTRSANITRFLQNTINAKLYADGIPFFEAIRPYETCSYYSGWTIVVVFENPDYDLNSISVFTGCNQDKANLIESLQHFYQGENDDISLLSGHSKADFKMHIGNFINDSLGNQTKMLFGKTPASLNRDIIIENNNFGFNLNKFSLNYDYHNCNFFKISEKPSNSIIHLIAFTSAFAKDLECNLYAEKVQKSPCNCTNSITDTEMLLKKAIVKHPKIKKKDLYQEDNDLCTVESSEDSYSDKNTLFLMLLLFLLNKNNS